MTLLDEFLRWLGPVSTSQASQRCAGCGEGILGDCLTALDQAWHPGHFRCGVCAGPLGLRFRVSPHREPFCAAHDARTVLCECCGHLICGPTAAQGFCRTCAQDLLTGPGEAEALLAGVQAHLRQAGLPWWPQAFPVRLVGPEELQIEGAQHGKRLVGLISKVTTTDGRGGVVRRVPEIRLLRGRPRVMQGAVIAHELGHAWLFQKGPQGLPAAAEEGFCEYCSHLWLRQVGDPRAPHLLRQIEQNPDPIYGEGFRTIRTLERGQGLRGVLAHLGNLSAPC